MKNRAPYGCPAKLDFNWRKRRGLVAHQRYGDGYIVIAEPPVLERVGHSRRAKLAERRSSISDAERKRMRTLSAAGKSLRQIARDIGVSHESVRRELADAKVAG